MINDAIDIIVQDLANAQTAANCDFGFVLRMILQRGAEEANYLSFWHEGRSAAEYKRIRIQLEGLIADLPKMLDGDGNVPPRHRAILREAFTLARYLIAIEREQTAGQLDMLDERLKTPRCRENRLTLEAA